MRLILIVILLTSCTHVIHKPEPKPASEKREKTPFKIKCNLINLECYA